MFLPPSRDTSQLVDFWYRHRNTAWFLDHPKRLEIENAPHEYVPMYISGDDAPLKKGGAKNARVVTMHSAFSVLPPRLSHVVISVVHTKEQFFRSVAALTYPWLHCRRLPLSCFLVPLCVPCRFLIVCPALSHRGCPSSRQSRGLVLQQGPGWYHAEPPCLWPSSYGSRRLALSGGWRACASWQVSTSRLACLRALGDAGGSGGSWRDLEEASATLCRPWLKPAFAGSAGDWKWEVEEYNPAFTWETRPHICLKCDANFLDADKHPFDPNILQKASAPR